MRVTPLFYKWMDGQGVVVEDKPLIRSSPIASLEQGDIWDFMHKPKL